MADALQSRLFRWAAAFLFIYSVILTISPAVRERISTVDYRWSHWLAFAVWLILTELANRVSALEIPERDPYLLPVAALLSGWGLLTIWRLDEAFGMRQMVWFAISISICMLGFRLSPVLVPLRRYKYVLLFGGLMLTAFTLLFGTNPTGFGPRLWLGCCGVYLQPSEPLKLLLVVYLAAYLAGRPPIHLRVFPLLLPTLLVTGLALLLLLVQRDLGTASIFILLFTMILFIVTNRRRVLVAAFLALGFSGLIGYFFIDIVRLRVDTWLNPWIDPSGGSYQIIQSLLAVANGGVFGRGPGVGNPSLVPVAISDFIFAAIAEETGLTGIIGLLSILALLLTRGIIASLRAPDRFRRFLAAGLTAYIGIQSLLIIGGNLRLVPLTGVTLPFVSYGGSSLLTSFMALLLLMKIGGDPEHEPAPLPTARPYLILTALLGMGIISAGLGTTWWSVIRGPDLLARTDNPRRSIADRYVLRGDILDQQDTVLSTTVGKSGELQREYLYPELSPILGYTHPVFGQAGLESSLDDYLRGQQGNPSRLIWWDHLLYGTPPPGLDVRLSLELPRQIQADQMFGAHAGGAILINARSGEILVMASHPTFDPNQLEEVGSELSNDPDSPLVNRVTQGIYPPGTATTPLLAILNTAGSPGDEQKRALFERLGLFATPQLRIPVTSVAMPPRLDDLLVSPLQMALAAATLSNDGTRPAPRIALAIDTPQQGWVVLPALSDPVNVFDPSTAGSAARLFSAEGQSYWEYVGQATRGGLRTTWYLGGTLPDWQGTPLAIALVLEEDNVPLARSIGRNLLMGALQP